MKMIIEYLSTLPEGYLVVLKGKVVLNHGKQIMTSFNGLVMKPQIATQNKVKEEEEKTTLTLNAHKQSQQ